MKKIGLFIVAALCISMLSACGGSKPAETTKAVETTAALPSETTAAETTASPETTEAETKEAVPFDPNYLNSVKVTDWFQPENEETAANWLKDNYSDFVEYYEDEDNISTLMCKFGNDKDAFLGICIIYNDPEVWPSYVAIRSAAYDDFEALDTIQIDIMKDSMGISKYYGEVDPDIEMQMDMEVVACDESGIDITRYEGDDVIDGNGKLQYLDKDETIGLLKAAKADAKINKAVSRFVDFDSLIAYVEGIFAQYGK